MLGVIMKKNTLGKDDNNNSSEIEKLESIKMLSASMPQDIIHLQ